MLRKLPRRGKSRRGYHYNWQPDLPVDDAYAALLLGNPEPVDGDGMGFDEALPLLHDDARASLAKTQERRRAVGSSLKRNQEPIDNAETAEISPMDRKQVQGESSRLKEELENLAAEEQLRTEQAKLGGLEDRVDRLEQVSDNPHETQMLTAIQ